MGHKIGSGKILPQDAKLIAIADYPKPTSRKQLKGFLGLCSYYYREYIQHFSKLISNLDKVTGKTSPRKSTGLKPWNETS